MFFSLLFLPALAGIALVRCNPVEPTVAATGASSWLSEDQFKAAVRNSINAAFAQVTAPNGETLHTQYLNLVNGAVASARVASKREMAMFLAQLIHESAGMTAKEEWGPPEAGKYPNPELDQPGKNYHGRGYLMLRWAQNYLAASTALFSDRRLLTEPEQVATSEEIAWKTAFWFWSAKVHEAPGVQDGNFGVTIQKIAPNECEGHHLADQRLTIYRTVLQAMNLGDGEGPCPNACDCVIPVPA